MSRLAAIVLVVGVAAAGLVAGGVVRAATADGGTEGSMLTAAVRDCPAGLVLTTYEAGSRVYAMARTESGAWIQVRDLAAPDRTVWVASRDVTLDANISSLPVTDCPQFDDVAAAAPTATETTTTLPGETTTTTEPATTTTTEAGTTTTTSAGTTTTTTAAPTTTTSTTTTTAPPDITPPNIAQQSAIPGHIWELDEDFLSCPGGTDRNSDIRAIVTDDVGVASVTASWTIGGSPSTVTMSPSGSFYSATFGPFPYLTVPDNTAQLVAVTITARDTSNNQSTAGVAVTVHSLSECFG